jgi:hypothetical protein
MSEWIPIDEELPESGLIIVWDKVYEMPKWLNLDDTDIDLRSVTHWFQLPPPPVLKER